MKHFLMIAALLLWTLAGTAQAIRCVDKLVFDGKGAGKVIFTLNDHRTKGITCTTCHEGQGFSFALFEMKQGADTFTMRKMELGSSCGACHNGQKAFSVADNLSCNRCHRK